MIFRNILIKPDGTVDIQDRDDNPYHHTLFFSKVPGVPEDVNHDSFDHELPNNDFIHTRNKPDGMWMLICQKLSKRPEENKGVITIDTKTYKPITGNIVGMGAERIEYEMLMAWMWNKCIENNVPFNTPIELNHDHEQMTKRGYLRKHEGEKMYSLSLKSIGILIDWSTQNL